MNTTIASASARKGGLALPLAIFVVLSLVATLLPTRERSLLPLDSRDLTGFLAQSAADEQLPGGFRDGLDDPLKQIGLAAADRAASLLNPVLRSGGATDRTGGRRAIRHGRGGSTGNAAQPGTAELPGDAADPESLALAPDTGTTDGTSGSGPNPGGNGETGGSSGGPPGGSSGGGVTTLALVDSLPEPGTWLMMIFGFAAIGQALRRQRRITSSEAMVTEPNRAIAS